MVTALKALQDTSFEDGNILWYGEYNNAIVGLGLANAPPTISTAHARTGTQSLLAPVHPSFGVAVCGMVSEGYGNAEGMTMFPGVEMDYSVWVYSEQANGVTLIVNFFAIGGVGSPSIGGTDVYVPLPAATWTEVSTVQTSPPGTTTMNLAFQSDNERIWLDDVVSTLTGWPTFYDGENTIPGAVRVEAHYSFGSGLTLKDGIRAGEQVIARAKDPSFYGTITLSADPEEGSRLDIRPGENILLKHHRTSGVAPINSNEGLIPIVGSTDLWLNKDTGFVWEYVVAEYLPYGYLFHIASVELDFDTLEMKLTVDTKARDLATLDQIIVRNKEGLRDPAKRLQLGRASGVHNDLTLPWDYEAGAGYIPTNFKNWGGHSPAQNASFYIHVNGSAGSDFRDRWTIKPILGAEKGTIMRTQITAYKANGTVKEVPFHFGIYSFEISYTDMPIDTNGNYNPFFEDAWVPIGVDPNLDESRADSGTDGFTGPHPQAYIIGWGQEGQRAGFWPGLESEGDTPTGILVDEGTWQFSLPRGENLLWVALYCEEEAWFRGRLIHGVQQ